MRTTADPKPTYRAAATFAPKPNPKPTQNHTHPHTHAQWEERERRRRARSESAIRFRLQRLLTSVAVFMHEFWTKFSYLFRNILSFYSQILSFFLLFSESRFPLQSVTFQFPLTYTHIQQHKLFLHCVFGAIFRYAALSLYVCESGTDTLNRHRAKGKDKESCKLFFFFLYFFYIFVLKNRLSKAGNQLAIEVGSRQAAVDLLQIAWIAFGLRVLAVAVGCWPLTAYRLPFRPAAFAVFRVVSAARTTACHLLAWALGLLVFTHLFATLDQNQLATTAGSTARRQQQIMLFNNQISHAALNSVQVEAPQQQESQHQREIKFSLTKLQCSFRTEHLRNLGSDAF